MENFSQPNHAGSIFSSTCGSKEYPVESYSEVTSVPAPRSACILSNMGMTYQKGTDDLPGHADKSATIKCIEDLLRCDAERDGAVHRPRVCGDSGNCHNETVYLSNVPNEMTCERLSALVQAFGEVSDIRYDSENPCSAEVVYTDSVSAADAVHYLNNAKTGVSDVPLAATLRSHRFGTQLFVGDLTMDVTEKMLEDAFRKIALSPVRAILKRDSKTFSPIGYGFLYFQNESAADRALVHGHRLRIGNALIRLGRAERNTFLYVTELNPSVSLQDLKEAFGAFGELVEDDTTIIHRSYAFVRFYNRQSAERAKRSLDKTDLNGRITVRYGETEYNKTIVHVQFCRSLTRPLPIIQELLKSSFSKYGRCSVEIPLLRNGTWRQVAFVHYNGEPFAAALAATLAIQNIKFVSDFPVSCQFSRELIPYMPHQTFPANTAFKHPRECRIPGHQVETTSGNIRYMDISNNNTCAGHRRHLASPEKGCSYEEIMLTHQQNDQSNPTIESKFQTRQLSSLGSQMAPVWLSLPNETRYNNSLLQRSYFDEHTAVTFKHMNHAVHTPSSTNVRNDIEFNPDLKSYGRTNMGNEYAF
jgi:hypothetical protein